MVQGIRTCGSGNTYTRESSNEGQPIKRVAPSMSLESQSFFSEYCSLVYFLYTIYGTSTVQGITELRHLCPLIAVFFPNNFHVVISCGHATAAATPATATRTPAAATPPPAIPATATPAFLLLLLLRSFCYSC